MNLQKTPIALAFALIGAAPLVAQAAPTVSFKTPVAGATLSQPISQSSACEVTGTNIKRVVFSVVSSTGTTTALNTETSAPWNCNIDPRIFSSGQYTLRAVAYDATSGGASATATRSVTLQNGTTSGGTTTGGTTTGGTTTTNALPVVTITAPANNSTLPSGSIGCVATATDADGIQQVQWLLNGTLISTELSTPYNDCKLNTTNLPNGTHTLKAVATDKKGAKGEAQITFTKGTTTSGGTTSGGTTTNPPPVVTITAPANNSTLPSGSIGCVATATDADGIQQVQWLLNGTLISTELSTPYNDCKLNTTSLPNGTHTLKAVATDKKGAKGEAQITFNKGTTTGGGSTTNTPPTVSLTAPVVGATLSGTTAPYSATASDTGGSVTKVDFYLVNASGAQTLVGTDTTNDYGGSFDTTKFANGTYTLMAVATDNAGATASTQRSVSISNTSSGSTGGDGTSGGTSGGTGTTLPANGASAIATFESLGVYWRPGADPGAAGCSLRYRKFSESAWREALSMWYDSRNSECRGSIVHLQPGTDYAVEMGVGASFKAGVNVKTWSESFPIAKTVKVQSGSNTLAITEGGTKDGYVLYEGPATIDVANAQDFNVTIAAPYVIVRGLTLKGAKRNGVHLLAGAHDVVIEDNEITGWGRLSTTLSNGWQVGVNHDSAVYAHCRDIGYSIERVTVQRNKLHDPRYTTNSWDFGHPLGPQAITMKHCGGNHVLRYNEIYSADGTKYLNDAIGGSENFSDIGFPSADTDIYGNKISHVWDDGIEAEGGMRNVRIWGNYLDQTGVGIATTVVHHGPAYVFRNVYNRSRKLANVGLDQGDRLNFAKSGTQPDFGGGRRYVFHNTILQATQSGLQYPLGAGGGIAAAGSTSPLTNTMSRNNILHIWKSSWNSIHTNGGGGNDLDYDLRNGNVSAYAGAEANGIVGTPIYKSGHGWQSWDGGNYQLDPSSPGYDRGVRIPNFNDAYTGSGPDMGAHEADTPAMRLGIGGGGGTWTGGSTSGTSGTTTGTTTASSGGLCATITCAAQ